MNQEEIKSIIHGILQGSIPLEEGAQQIERGFSEPVGSFAVLDHQRAARTGFPEVIYGPGKTTGQIIKIFQHLQERNSTVMATRIERPVADILLKSLPDATYNEAAKILYVCSESPTREGITVVTAGTGDIPVAEEAALTAELMGNRVNRIFDVGVAGIHRLFNRLTEIRQARVIIAVAGMEGALASVIGGLVSCPVIAVPTSIGYGANFQGITPLLAMLSSCANGIGVVNIDNGYGAGCLAARINRLSDHGAA